MFRLLLSNSTWIDNFFRFRFHHFSSNFRWHLSVPFCFSIMWLNGVFLPDFMFDWVWIFEFHFSLLSFDLIVICEEKERKKYNKYIKSCQKKKKHHPFSQFTPEKHCPKQNAHRRINIHGKKIRFQAQSNKQWTLN